eukprot:scaffold53647_cov59-Attheya_sp.AAC.2
MFEGNLEFEGEDEMAVDWSMDHDSLILENDYIENDPSFDELSVQYKDVLLGSRDYTWQDQPIISEPEMSQFNDEQVLAHDNIVRAALQEPNVMAKNGGISRLIILIGVGGVPEDWGEDNYTVFVMTGLATTNVHRSMNLLGGVTIVLASDPGQELLPVKGNALWNSAAGNVVTGKHDFAGFGLYQYFETVVKLVRNVQINPDDPDVVTFNDFQMWLHDGRNGQDDYDIVRKTCSRHSTMPEGEWKCRGFDDPNTLDLFCTNKEVQMHNCKCIKTLGTPIAFIHADHTGKGAIATNNTGKGFVALIYLAVGAKVLVTSNVTQPAGVCNGSFGTVK